MNIFQANFWQYSVLGNSVENLSISLGILIGLLIIFKVFQAIVLRRLGHLAEKTKTDIDDTLVQVVKSVNPPFYFFLAFYLALGYLTIHETARSVIGAILVIWAVYQAVKALNILVGYVVKRGIKEEDDPGARSAIALTSKLIKGVLWAVGALFVLSNLGVNITSVIAGLGIGGVAVALALQNILGDLFSSFAIFFDKPFVTGDFIIIGEHRGTVERVGIKTTRLRALGGEELVISNQELTSARIQNFKRMEERRAVFHVGVTYETPSEKLRQIPSFIKEIITSTENARFDRTHFARFDDFALTFEIVYYTNSRDYATYMDTQEKINFALKEKFEKENIEFAYPTQLIYTKGT
jgi:small-conductance mechanosensitive channel